MMTAALTPLRRRWFQFSLASLIWLMLVVALVACCYREHQMRIQVEKRLELLERFNRRLVHATEGVSANSAIER